MQSKRKSMLVQTSVFTAVNPCVQENRVAWLLNAATVRIVEELSREFTGHREVLRMGVIDWGMAVWPRSVGHQRIQGNIAAHYGLAEQNLFVQMLTNKLKEEETEGGGKSVNV